MSGWEKKLHLMDHYILHVMLQHIGQELHKHQIKTPVTHDILVFHERND